MPVNGIGQMITFSEAQGADETFTQYVWIRARRHDTIQAIAARRGHPEQAAQIAKLNGIRSVRTKLHKGHLLRLPGTLTAGDVVHVLADDPRPLVMDGYAKYETIDVPGRKGITRFTGYDPIKMDVPIQFEDFSGGDGQAIEDDIATLERMAGRGHFPGAAIGPPAVVRVSVTDNRGNIMALIPSNYQWSPGNPTAPTWRIEDLVWASGAMSNQQSEGRRVRQKAVVTLGEFTAINLVERSSSKRSRARNG